MSLFLVRARPVDSRSSRLSGRCPGERRVGLSAISSAAERQESVERSKEAIEGRSGSKKSSNGECRPLIIVASTTVKDLFSKVDAIHPLSSFVSSSSLFLFYLPFVHLRLSFVASPWSPPFPATRPGLSLLQIGLVVLRVHQDNSALALYFFQENAVGLRRWNARGAVLREQPGNILYAGVRACALCFALFEIPWQQHQRVSPLRIPFLYSLRAFTPFRLATFSFFYLRAQLLLRNPT